uniref:Uncharacterized protein n=1 Tax=Chrysemys picta bellii TaxID=8478 RepID=A0A8C3I7G6_CHRPI
MHGHQKCRSRDKDELKGPQSNVRDGEEVVIANIFASRLQSVADKIILFVSPDFLRSHHKDHNTENEHDSEPDLSDTVHYVVTPSQKRYIGIGKGSEKGNKNN